MNLKVLVDNNTIIDKYFRGEAGLSFYIEDEGKKILFDLGYSNIFLENMKSLNISSEEIDVLAISHGHDDHTGGIKYLYNKKLNPNLKIIAHPLTFNEKIRNSLSSCCNQDDLGTTLNNSDYKNYECISSPLEMKEVKHMGEVILTKEPLKISKNIYYLGQIPNTMDFEPRYSIGKIKIDDKYEDDYIYDDTALVYKGEEGLFIIAGCSHSGICNIVEYAKKVCNDERIVGIIGGTHLRDCNERVKKTLEYFKNNNIDNLDLCHCTSFAAKCYINNSIPIKDVGVGMEIEIS